MRQPALSASALRRALRLDAAASGAMGIALLAGAGPLAAPLGLPATLLAVVGAGLVPFAAALLWLAARPTVPAGGVRIVVVGNAAWVVASAALALGGLLAPTALGVAFVLAQAGAVAVLTALEVRGLRTGALPAPMPAR